eukprot:1755038-Pyramimonas_sp.AAC.1
MGRRAWSGTHPVGEVAWARGSSGAPFPGCLAGRSAARRCARNFAGACPLLRLQMLGQTPLGGLPRSAPSSLRRL